MHAAAAAGIVAPIGTPALSLVRSPTRAHRARSALLNLHVDKPLINNCTMGFDTQPVRACALITRVRAMRAASAYSEEEYCVCLALA